MKLTKHAWIIWGIALVTVVVLAFVIPFARAAVYWLARMLEAGEDPLYVARRVVRFASEDVGLADPRALELAVAAYQAADAAAASGVVVGGILHGLPRQQHLGHGLVARHLALVHIRLQHDLPERLALLLHAVKYFLHRIQSHRHPPPCRSRSWTARPAARTETPPGWA